MIKRWFYKFEHGDKDNVSDASSSSSDSELEGEAPEELESEEEEVVQIKENDQACSTSLGYESGDSSANDFGVDTAGCGMSGILDDDNDETEDDKHVFINNKLHSKHGAQILKKNLNTPTNEEPLPDDFPACVLKCKSVFKCKLCLRIVYLNEETMRAHVNPR
ncbi:hypothetical protein DITRI_Ditri11bG0014700 [Diplodiscus trichospermus]